MDTAQSRFRMRFLLYPYENILVNSGRIDGKEIALFSLEAVSRI